jgi:hypothetical protein
MSKNLIYWILPVEIVVLLQKSLSIFEFTRFVQRVSFLFSSL